MERKESGSTHHYGDIELSFLGTCLLRQEILSLVYKGFYDGVIFHRIIEGFMIRGETQRGLVWEVQGMEFRMSLRITMGMTRELSPWLMQALIQVAASSSSTL